MSEQYSFRPPTRRGLLFHGALILVLGCACALAFFTGLNQHSGDYFVVFLILSLLLFAPLPWIAYRAYALTRASYRIERDGLRLRWGMRSEDIPLPEIEWVRRISDMAADLRLPGLHWPGALLGSANTADLGRVDFLAADSELLLLLATPQRIYAISPEDPEAFLRAFQRSLELGSLAPLAPVSVLPAAYLSQIWANTVTRTLLVSGFLLNLLLLVGVSLLIPGRAITSLGFYPNGAPLPGVPAQQLLLLPILGAFIYVADLAAGLFFYRQDHLRAIAYMIWSSAVLSGLLLIAAVVMIVTTIG